MRWNAVKVPCNGGRGMQQYHIHPTYLISRLPSGCRHVPEREPDEEQTLHRTLNQQTGVMLTPPIYEYLPLNLTDVLH